MTNLTVRCILCGMEESNWTEQQLIEYVKSNGCPAFDARQLKRYRQEKLVHVEREYPEFGGSHSSYRRDTGHQALAICRLLKEKRNFDVVRLRLWQQGQEIDLSLLKQSLLTLAPIQATQLVRRSSFVEQQVQKIMQRLEKLIRYSEWRTVLQRLPREEDRRDFLTMQVSFMTGMNYIFDPYVGDTFNAYQRKDVQREQTSAEILKRGLHLEDVTFLPEDERLSEDLNRFSLQQLLSLKKFQEDLEAATEADLRLANNHLELIELLAQVSEITGTLAGPPQLYRIVRSIRFQAFALLFLLRLNKCGFRNNIQTLLDVLRIHVPVLQRGQKFYRFVQQELPHLTKEFPSFRQLSRFTPQQQEAIQARLSQVYQQNKPEIDAFMQRHPELSEGEQQVTQNAVSDQ
jgi:hypothetical protein